MAEPAVFPVGAAPAAPPAPSAATLALLRSREGPIVEVEAAVDGKAPITFTGRPAHTLALLILNGRRGLTALDMPGARLGHFVFLLRRAGVSITTENEAHSGPFCGRHGRYHLGSRVEVLRAVRAGEPRTRRKARRKAQEARQGQGACDAA
jgi:hypothetical protein